MRDSFLVPIVEFETATELLSRAADAILRDDARLASELLRQADMPEIMAYFRRVVGKNDPAIHGTAVQPKPSPTGRVQSRMPTAAVEADIYRRDGWHCRFCDTRVISRKARKIFISRFPEETHWKVGEYARHSALQVLAASVDHIVPHSRGGNNDLTNLVTACTACNFGRGAWTLEEVRLADPLGRPPISDGWDGLSRLTSATSTGF